MTRLAAFTLVLISYLSSTGCANEHRIEVDLSTTAPRFILTGKTWGWPFVWPRVNALAIGADSEPVWELEALDKQGVAARELAIVYGEVPKGFVQKHPGGDVRPGRLIPGKTYYVGATGPGDEVFRTIFALPMDPLGPPPDPAWTPDRKKMNPPS